MLKNLQANFLSAAFNKDFPVHSFIASPNSDERFNVYRQTILENLRNSLSLTYPGVWKLLGEECANSLAYAFCHEQNHLPVTGCLEDWGEEFPIFLSTIKELSSVPYISDYARYEWQQHQAYGAHHEDPLNIITLKNVHSDQVHDLQFLFIPSFSAYESPYPIHDIQQTLKHDRQLNLHNKKSYGFIVRPENEIITLWVEHALWIFICSLHQGHALKIASQNALQIKDNFDLTQAIQFLIENKLTYKIHFNGE